MHTFLYSLAEGKGKSLLREVPGLWKQTIVTDCRTISMNTEHFRIALLFDSNMVVVYANCETAIKRRKKGMGFYVLSFKQLRSYRNETWNREEILFSS